MGAHQGSSVNADGLLLLLELAMGIKGWEGNAAEGLRVLLARGLGDLQEAGITPETGGSPQRLGDLPSAWIALMLPVPKAPHPLTGPSGGGCGAAHPMLGR